MTNRLSTCCSAPVSVAGKGMTHWYECQKCEQACDQDFGCAGVKSLGACAATTEESSSAIESISTGAPTKQTMATPTFDSNDYPTEETIGTIAMWPIADPDGWLDFIRAAWNHHYGKMRYTPNFAEFATGGWSGNESIIVAMRENLVLWTLLWESSHRGGKYVLRLPETNK